MKIDYIDFFSRVIPDWMARNNQTVAQVGFNTEAYWQWVVDSMNEICKQYNNDQLVKDQLGLLFAWLDSRTKGGGQ